MSILEEDFESILKSPVDWDLLKNATVLVTGATGMIGSYLVKMFGYVNQRWQMGIEILAAVHRLEQVQKVLQGCDCTIICGDVRETLSYKGKIDFIFHCASVTRSQEMIVNPVETVETIVKGTEIMLKLALERKVRSIVFFSSMEIYGRTFGNKEWTEEEDLGYIDLFRVRSCYPTAKRLAEHMCFAYFQEYGVPVKIARLSQTFGPGILQDENRIFAQLAKCAIDGKNIVLHTKGEASGNYCYLADCIKGVLTLLLKGQNGEAYNITNESCCATIREMADIVAKEVAEGKIEVTIQEQSQKADMYPEAVKLKLSSRKLRQLGWNASTDLRDMYKRMIVYMKDMT